MSRARYVGGALAVALALGAPPAGAFCRTVACPPGKRCPAGPDGCPTGAPPLFWRTSCVGFSFQRDTSANYRPDALRDAVRRGLRAWMDVECPGGGQAGIRFVERSDASCDRVEFNEDGPNANVILFQDDGFEYESIFNTLARTVVTYDNETGQIRGADLEINTSNNHFSLDGADATQTDLQSLIAHEAGHFLGLAHTQEENEGATMKPFIGPGDVDPRALSPDDVAALCAVYPPGSERKGCDPEPWGGFTSACGGEPDACAVGAVGARPPAAGGLVAAALAWAASRRRRPARPGSGEPSARVGRAVSPGRAGWRSPLRGD